MNSKEIALKIFFTKTLKINKKMMNMWLIFIRVLIERIQLYKRQLKILIIHLLISKMKENKEKQPISLHYLNQTKILIKVCINQKKDQTVFKTLKMKAMENQLKENHFKKL